MQDIMMILSFTKNPEPVVEGDDDDGAEGGEDAGVPEVPRSPLERLPVHVHHDGKKRQSGCRKKRRKE